MRRLRPPCRRWVRGWSAWWGAGARTSGWPPWAAAAATSGTSSRARRVSVSSSVTLSSKGAPFLSTDGIGYPLADRCSENCKARTPGKEGKRLSRCWAMQVPISSKPCNTEHTGTSRYRRECISNSNLCVEHDAFESDLTSARSEGQRNVTLIRLVQRAIPDASLPKAASRLSQEWGRLHQLALY